MTFNQTRLAGLMACTAIVAVTSLPAIAQEETTLTFVRAGDSATVAEVFDPMLRAFEQANPGVTIQSIPMGFDEANRRFPLMAATGEMPDVVAPPESLSATLGAQGAFLSLDGLLSDELVSDIPQSLWEFPCSAPTGEIVGVPANAGGTVLWYNTDVFEAAGLDPDSPPRTSDELVAAAQAIEDNTDADGIGLNGFARNDMMDTFAAIVGSHYGEWYWDPETESVKVNEATIGAADFLGMLVADGLTQSSVESYNRADTRSLLRDGSVGMTFDGPWAIGVLNAAVDDITSPDSPYRTTRVPGPDGPDATAMSLSCYNIAATTEHQDLAIALVEFLSNPENMLRHAEGYGVMPVRNSVLSDETFQVQPWSGLAAAVANTSFAAKPAIEELTLVENDIPGAIQSVLLDRATGEEAMNTLADSQGWPR